MSDHHPQEELQRVGLCAICRHAKRIESDRGSTFYMCGLSAHDKRFPKYPHLPRLQCDGFEKKETTDG